MENNFDELQKKIDEFKEKNDMIPKKIEVKDRKLHDLFMEFIVISLVGAGFGYLIDKWLHTTPIFFLICLLFGVISGVAKIYQHTK